MLKVLVFEDNIDELNTLQKYAKNFFDARNISYHIDYKSTFPDDLSCLSNYAYQVKATGGVSSDKNVDMVTWNVNNKTTTHYHTAVDHLE